ncbi:exodeoxyribonuclease I [Chromobacterium haemolyticum]|uniref:Exodeoxyribonuclease I n=1 Tax=Chromobacterium haemolyticum TaxID=394935 RepID=A0ABS3GLS2_9NEIS|nr:exodeoxyribonuclease I [Chromobacterium haemolyticum]MBK0414380.1 exodeoxyribonuclease I [Chromobacterium haemolyticum]MBO0415986.1 exodeoxyribonuclease I [Chromobacterium haemolyticum]MBO0499246.1 exodeoxyribonuclease I [Chromobacterium haemolyticum]
MSNHSFFWHDYETFGAVPRQDRPSQFAGIRTDADLNEIGEPVMLYARPAPDYLPSPVACLLTGITPQWCLQHGVAEHEFAGVIERELATPGTIGVGYNSIRFDDEVTRFLFWRNLMDPYAREWQNQCGRWDLLDLVRATFALRPDGIQWPQHEDGRPSFKLEHLSAANGLAHEAAHDALSDVRATIALARLIKRNQPKLFDFYLSLRKKDAVKVQLSLHAPKPVLHVSGMYGAERGNMAVVWPLAAHPYNANEVIVWDLSHDPRELQGLGPDAIRERLYTRSEDLPEGVQRLPLKTVHINKSPFVVANLKVLSPERAAHWGLDMEQVQRHADYAGALPDLTPVWRKVYKRESGEPRDVDENLYGGFVSNNDRKVLTKLRRMSADQLAGEMAFFEDPQLAELLFRYRARNFPRSLSGEEQQRWQTWRQAKLNGGPGRDFQQFRQELAEARAGELNEQAQSVLAQLEAYAAQL